MAIFTRQLDSTRIHVSLSTVVLLIVFRCQVLSRGFNVRLRGLIAFMQRCELKWGVLKFERNTRHVFHMVYFVSSWHFYKGLLQVAVSTRF